MTDVLVVAFTPSIQEIELLDVLWKDMGLSAQLLHEDTVTQIGGPYRLLIQVGLHGRDGKQPEPGLLFLKSLAGQFGGTPILVITGHRYADMIDRVRQCGGTDMLHRPYAHAELVSKIGRMIIPKISAG